MFSKDIHISLIEKVVVFFCLLSVLAFGNYSMPAQVKDFIFYFSEAWSIGEVYYHVHILRFIMLLPQVIFSWITGLSYDLVFHISVPIMLLILFKYMRECASQLLGESSKVYISLWPIVSLLLIYANGRALFAFISVAILLKLTYNMLKGRPIRYIDIVASLFLSGISSGVSIVVYACFILNLMSIKGGDVVFKHNGEKLKWCLCIFSPVVAMWLIKNVLYFFEGVSFFKGVEDLLAHGAFNFSLTMVLVSVLVCSIGVFAIFKYRMLMANMVSSCPPLFLHTVMISCLFVFGGFFGILTVLSAIPVYLIGFLAVVESISRRMFRLG